MKRAWLSVLALVLTACGSTSFTTNPTEAVQVRGSASASAAPPTPAASLDTDALVAQKRATAPICEYFSALSLDTVRQTARYGQLGNPNDTAASSLLTKAWAAAFQESAGLPTDLNADALARDAINEIDGLASRSTGDEQRDLQNLSSRLDQAALAGQLSGIVAILEPFYVKYASRCGAEIASDG